MYRIMSKKRTTLQKLKMGLASLLLAIIPCSFSAQQQISLQEAIKQALQNKAEAKKAELKIRKAEYRIREAKAGMLPQISGSANLSYDPVIQESLLQFGGEKIRATMGQTWNSGASVSLNQALYDQSVFIGLKAAATTREFYIINTRITSEQLIENVATAYYKVLVQEENLKTIQESYTNTEKVRAIIKSLVESGLSKKIDLERTTVQLTNIGSDRQRQINSLELSKNSLKFYMGIPIESEIELEEKSIETRPELMMSTPDMENRSELKSLIKQKQLLQYSKESTKANLYPTVSLQAKYGWAGMGAHFPFTNGYGNGVLWSDYFSIGLNIKVPIFSGGATKAKIQQAEIDILNADQDIANEKLNLDLEYKNAVANMENSLINIESMKNNVLLAEKVQKDSRSNYQYGLATLTEVLDAEKSLTEAKQNHANALLDYRQAEIQLIKSRGELNTLQNP
jgi:outer membrane protein